ncbi:hypothetical protein B0H63DRAFT_40804 [Podospora didyma]|uniref:Uncharacterized protein n=1 Tax=Podospora didyma TaxID=330526 RepID=A0AAE0U8A1_9PEZI|nr:hypothetical protein B0H63DRAFT_40804 [Podospora didyma]
MLSRPTFNIRRLIPHHQRRPSDVEFDEDASFFIHDDIDSLKAANRIKSWRPPMGFRKGSKPVIDIRKAEDIHRIVSIPALPDTPHSSTSSLCSCEHGTDHVGHVSPRSSPPRRPGNNRSPQRSPLLCPEQLEHPQQRGRGRSPVSPRTFHHNAPLSPPATPVPRQGEFPSEPTTTADLPATEPPSVETDPEPVAAPEQAIESQMSEDVQQLIRETDAAFQLSSSFAHARLPSPVLATFPQLATPSAPVRRKSQRSSQSSIKSPTKAPLKTQTPVLATPARLASASRTKRTKSKKSRRRPPRAPARQSSMWTLTESAKDLFTIRIFHRLEADEMLPESELREIRMSRACQAQWGKPKPVGADEAAANKMMPTTTPVEPPSHVEDSSNPQNITTDMPVIIERPETPISKHAEGMEREESLTPKPEHQQQQRTSTPTREQDREQAASQQERQEELPQQGQQQQNRPSNAEDEEDEAASLPIMMIVEEKPVVKPMTLPSTTPPVKNMHRRLPSRQLPPLPTIPEIIATGPDNAVLSPTSAPPPIGSTTKINKDDYVFLPTTPFTLTMPTFRHGPVRLAKADLPIGKLAAAVDDTLDWTAFQMAILGGAGDFFSEPTDYSRPSEAELDERDELVTWFTGFGFQSPGSLQTCGVAEARTPGLSPHTGKPDSPSSTPNSSPRSLPKGGRSPGMMMRRVDPPPSACDPDHEGHFSAERLGNSIASRFSIGQEHRRGILSGDGFDTVAAGVGSGVWGGRLQSRRHVGLAIDSTRRPSVDSLQSLPQSPMLDLVVSKDVEGNEYVVPMGFNLGHDLGDFLKWESENVYATGYYGADEA